MLSPTPLDLRYRPDLNVFTARWLAGPDEATTPGEYEAILRATEARRTARWLFDVRRRPATTDDSVRWITTQWLPRAAALLHPIRLCLAYLVPPVRAEHLHTDETLHAVMAAAYAPGQPFSLRIFTDEGEAMRWLLAQPAPEVAGQP